MTRARDKKPGERAWPRCSPGEPRNEASYRGKKPATEGQLHEALALFPGLSAGYRSPSVASSRYNCLAWVIGETSRVWWVDAAWLPEVSREDRVESFLSFLGRHGDVLCEHEQLEPEQEKIAIYVQKMGPLGLVQHVAWQMPDGWWSSKLGRLIDVEHRELWLAEEYGDEWRFVRRPRTWDLARRPR